MKQMIFVNGTMGVGKSTVCSILYRQLPRCAFLDGDWCWMMHPFTVTEETKEMVLDNISHLLGNFLRCSAYETILFCWVMDRQEILDALLSRLHLEHCDLRIFTLTAQPDALAARVESDIAAGIRAAGDTARSLERCPLYDNLATEKIDTTHLTPEETAREIIRKLKP
jgi:hypothetical protein